MTRPRRYPNSGLRATVYRWLRFPRLRHIGSRDVLEIAQALGAAGIPYWLAGGWGVDALLGRQTRRHVDLDVAVDYASADPAIAALSVLGFAVVGRTTLPAWMPNQISLRDRRRRWIELMLIHADHPTADPLQPERMRYSYGAESFAVGMVGAERVPCLSAVTQRLFHTGYPHRRSDRQDMAILAQVQASPADPGP